MVGFQLDCQTIEISFFRVHCQIFPMIAISESVSDPQTGLKPEKKGIVNEFNK